MNNKIFQKKLIILMLVTALPLWAQNDNELTDTERQEILEAEHEKTGIEVYLYYPLPVFMPGWIFSSKTYESGPADITMPGLNLSFINICFGADMEFDSSKRILKDMGFGMAVEWNVLDSFNMEGHDATLFQSYTYLFYSEDTAKFADYYFRVGIGLARISNQELFSTKEEKDNPKGPLILLEAGSNYPPLGNFRLYSGLTYKYISINSKNIHVLAPFIRTSYRF